MTPAARRNLPLRRLSFLPLLFWANSAAFARTLDEELVRLRADGFSVEQRAGARAQNAELTTLLLRRRDGGSSRLVVYAEEGAAKKRPRRARLLHFDTCAAGLRLSSIHAGGRLPDIAGDGSFIIAYIFSYSGIGQESLVLLRYAKGRLSRIGAPIPFAEFQDVNDDGRLEIVSKERPLGSFFTLECRDFFVPASSAARTRIFRLERGGRLEPVSKEVPSFYARHMSELEGLLREDPVKTGRYGEYLGAALSLYYDYAELGRRREGFSRLRQAFQPPGSLPSSAQHCFLEMEETLRRRLSIPKNWN